MFFIHNYDVYFVAQLRAAFRMVFPIVSFPASEMAVLNRIKSLSAEQFENLTFDLLQLSGMQNAVWRTPGRDGGRDIEGDYPVEDLSGYSQTQRWYVECKKYSTTLDWPTIHAKVAYAQSHVADFLLIVTTATASPQAIDEINRWNRKFSTPKIRIWAAHDLGRNIRLHPLLVQKYQLESTSSKNDSLSALSLLLLKHTQSAYSWDIFEDSQNPYLETSAALADLSSHLATMLERGDKWTKIQTRKIDIYDWVKGIDEQTASSFDRYALRALFAMLRENSRDKNIATQCSSKEITVALDLLTTSSSFWKEMRIIAVLGGIELSNSDKKLSLKIQKT